MLVDRSHLKKLNADIDTIHNYYENLVLEKLQERHQSGLITAEMIADVACVALNRLPPRYIRYDVDMSFYLSPKEYEEIDTKVDNAVEEALEFVRQRGQRD